MLARKGLFGVLIISIAVTLGVSAIGTPVYGESPNAQHRPAAVKNSVSDKQIATGAPAGASASPVQKAQRHEEEKRQANDHVVSILGSGITGTYAQFAEDIRNVIELDKNNKLRVVPILGRSAGLNLVDIVFLKGVDMGIVDQDALFYLKKKDPILYGDIDQRVHYAAKVFDSEFHVVAHKDIGGLSDLRGKKINCLQPLSAAGMVCDTLFEALGIPVEILHLEAEQALAKLKNGEIAAAARVGGAPIPGFTAIKPEDNLHFVPVGRQSLAPADFDKVRALYTPARLRHEHYPQLIPEGETVPTIATGAVLAVYNWPQGSLRREQINTFVKLFFENIEKFRQPPRHNKWKDVNLAAETPGWRRYKAAQDWLNSHRDAHPGSVPVSNSTEMAAAFEKFARDYSTLRHVKELTPEHKKAIYAQFRVWWDARGATPTPAAGVAPMPTATPASLPSAGARN